MRSPTTYRCMQTTCAAVGVYSPVDGLLESLLPGGALRPAQSCQLAAADVVAAVIEGAVLRTQHTRSGGEKESSSRNRTGFRGGPGAGQYPGDKTTDACVAAAASGCSMAAASAVAAAESRRCAQVVCRQLQDGPQPSAPGSCFVSTRKDVDDAQRPPYLDVNHLVLWQLEGTGNINSDLRAAQQHEALLSVRSNRTE